MPGASLAAGLAQDPGIHLADQAMPFGGCDELAGVQQPAARMLPAHECLEAVQAGVGQAQDGLVVDHEFVALDGQPQVAHQVE